MKFLKHAPAVLLFIIGAVLCHYYLPDREVVQIVGTEVKRFDIGRDAPFWDKADIGTNEHETRDVFQLHTVRTNGKELVFRNEDTGWGWPPYFKFNSSDVTARAKKFERIEDQWVVVRHYGWRIQMFSIFPNATSIKPVSGPNVKFFPLFNLVFIAILLSIWAFLWWKIRAWKAKRLDPTFDKVGDTLGEAARDVSEGVGEGSKKAQGLWRKLFGTTKPRK